MNDPSSPDQPIPTINTVDPTSSPVSKIKTRSWIVLGVGGAISLVPYVGFIMWLLFLPVVIFAGFCGYKLLKSNERRHGIIVLSAAFLFIPFVFIASIVSTAVVAGALSALKGGSDKGVVAARQQNSSTGPEGDQNGAQSGDGGTVSDTKQHDAVSKAVNTDSKKTIDFWKRMREIETRANSSFKDDSREYPMAGAGQYDFPKFSNEDFESLMKYHFDRGETQQKVSIDIGNMPILGVDQDLVRYKLELCEHWSSCSQVTIGMAKMVNALHQQKVSFTSTDAYALRMAKALLKQGDMEAEYQQNQQEIEEMRKKWTLIRDRDDKLREQIQKSEQAIKAALTTRYSWEFN